ncbi:unnamed protein product [Protopolystoma xenopodis]|uniref:Uncharacterized protein n=1 Tax=Protopolystoma xenopodis TaxID=117903 RepID=A0A3S4ZPY7_9PLAT|nr:unnamed protein product [Protopolystoma xenopodis]
MLVSLVRRSIRRLPSANPSSLSALSTLSKPSNESQQTRDVSGVTTSLTSQGMRSISVAHSSFKLLVSGGNGMCYTTQNISLE